MSLIRSALIFKYVLYLENQGMYCYCVWTFNLISFIWYSDKVYPYLLSSFFHLLKYEVFNKRMTMSALYISDYWWGKFETIKRRATFKIAGGSISLQETRREK